jgi:hypothetical protein
MDHIVFVDYKAGELEKLISGEKTIVIRGATGRKLPYGRVNSGDSLYFIRNNGEGLVRAKAVVIDVYNSERMNKEESKKLVDVHIEGLQLSDKQYKKWAGKRYLVLITVGHVNAIDPFRIDRSNYGNMDDWLPVENIETVK